MYIAGAIVLGVVALYCGFILLFALALTRMPIPGPENWVETSLTDDSIPERVQRSILTRVEELESVGFTYLGAGHNLWNTGPDTYLGILLDGSGVTHGFVGVSDGGELLIEMTEFCTVFADDSEILTNDSLQLIVDEDGCETASYPDAGDLLRIIEIHLARIASHVASPKKKPSTFSAWLEHDAGRKSWIKMVNKGHLRETSDGYDMRFLPAIPIMASALPPGIQLHRWRRRRRSIRILAGLEQSGLL